MTFIQFRNRLKIISNLRQIIDRLSISLTALSSLDTSYDKRYFDTLNPIEDQLIDSIAEDLSVENFIPFEESIATLEFIIYDTEFCTKYEKNVYVDNTAATTTKKRFTFYQDTEEFDATINNLWLHLTAKLQTSNCDFYENPISPICD